MASRPSHVTTTCGHLTLLDDSTSEDELHIVLQDNSFTASESAADTSLPVSVPTQDSSSACDQPTNNTLSISVPNDKSSSGFDNADVSLRVPVCVENDVVLDSPIKKCSVVLLHDPATVNLSHGASAASEKSPVPNTDSSSKDLLPSVASIVAEMSLFRPLSPIPNCRRCELCDAARVDDSVSGTRVIMHQKRAAALKRKLSEESDDDDVKPAKVSSLSSHV